MTNRRRQLGSRIRWAGVDVGGPQKGFDVVVLDRHGVICGPVRRTPVADVVAFLRGHGATIVAVDAPIRPARKGQKSRQGERELVKSRICKAYYTPDSKRIKGNEFYFWMSCGLDLHRALEKARIKNIECFPTASWTMWAGKRGAKSRRGWTQSYLKALKVPGVPRTLGQDGRDAIAAALTAKTESERRNQRFGDIRVPRTKRKPWP